MTDGDTTTTGYVIKSTSFLMALAYTDDGPQAQGSPHLRQHRPVRSDPAYTEATQRFSDKEWRTVLFRAEDVSEGVLATTTVRG